MLRLTKMSGVWYGVKIDEDLERKSEIEAIVEFASQGEPVIIVADLDDAQEIINADGFDLDDVVIV